MRTCLAKTAFRRAERVLYAGGFVLAVALGAAMVCAAPTLQPPPDPTSGVSTVPATALDLRAPDIKTILDRGELIVAMTEGDQPPFYYVGPDGQPSLQALVALESVTPSSSSRAGCPSPATRPVRRPSGSCGAG